MNAKILKSIIFYQVADIVKKKLKNKLIVYYLLLNKLQTDLQLYEL